MNPSFPPYELEDIREFFVRRPWMHGKRHRLDRDKLNWDNWTEESYQKYTKELEEQDSVHPFPLTDEEYKLLKSRELTLESTRVSHLRSFIEGYWWAK